jgi:hypothetical protein
MGSLGDGMDDLEIKYFACSCFESGFTDETDDDNF